MGRWDPYKTTAKNSANLFLNIPFRFLFFAYFLNGCLCCYIVFLDTWKLYCGGDKVISYKWEIAHFPLFGKGWRWGFLRPTFPGFRFDNGLDPVKIALCGKQIFFQFFCHAVFTFKPFKKDRLLWTYSPPIGLIINSASYCLCERKFRGFLTHFLFLFCLGDCKHGETGPVVRQWVRIRKQDTGSGQVSLKNLWK